MIGDRIGLNEIMTSREMRQMKTNRLLDIISHATAELTDHNLDHSQLLSEQLISCVLSCARLELYSRSNDILNKHQVNQIYDGIKRMVQGEPLQYITGQTDFMGHRFKVDNRCLIPRPETEALVEWIAGFEPLWKIPQPVIIDAGTGSGCIAISLALNKPEGRYIAIDISEPALSAAKENAAMHGVQERIQFKHHHLLNGLSADSADAVISNPPYVRTDEWERLERHIRDHEPRTALDGGSNGLSVINPLILQSFHVLKHRGFIFMEAGEDQWLDIQASLESAGFRGSTIRQDLTGKKRMICANK